MVFKGKSQNNLPKTLNHKIFSNKIIMYIKTQNSENRYKHYKHESKLNNLVYKMYRGKYLCRGIGTNRYYTLKMQSRSQQNVIFLQNCH